MEWDIAAIISIGSAVAGAIVKHLSDIARTRLSGKELQLKAEKEADERAYEAFQGLLGQMSTRLDNAYRQLEGLSKVEVTLREELARKSVEIDAMRRELRELRSQLSIYSLVSQAVMESVKDAIITINERGQIQAWNHAATRLFGWTAGEVVGRNVNVIMPKEESKVHDGYLEEYMKTGESHIIGVGRLVRAMHKDGTIFEAQLSVSELPIIGSKRRLFTGVLSPIKDPSESGVHDVLS